MKCVLWVILSVLCLIIGAFLLFMLILIISSCLVDPKRDYNKHSKYYRWLLNSSTWILIFLGRIHLHPSGLEKLPQNQRFLLVCNHKSKLDPITTWYMLKKYDLAFISKEKNFHVLFWGKIIRKCCFMSIDRDNPRKAMATINRAIDLINDDQVSVAVYPEGTRNFGEGLLPFRNGVFKIAKKANVPIVICGIKGTDKIKTNYPLKRSDVFFEILDVLPPDVVETMHTNEIGDYASKLILRYIEESQEE